MTTNNEYTNTYLGCLVWAWDIMLDMYGQPGVVNYDHGELEAWVTRADGARLTLTIVTEQDEDEDGDTLHRTTDATWVVTDDGVTIDQGGHPFENEDDRRDLLDMLHEWAAEATVTPERLVAELKRNNEYTTTNREGVSIRWDDGLLDGETPGLTVTRYDGSQMDVALETRTDDDGSIQEWRVTLWGEENDQPVATSSAGTDGWHWRHFDTSIAGSAEIIGEELLSKRRGAEVINL